MNSFINAVYLIDSIASIVSLAITIVRKRNTKRAIIR